VPQLTISLTSPPTTVYIAWPFRAPHSLLPAFEDGTDTWFRNVGTAHIDAGEIPKRTFIIFSSKLPIKTYLAYGFFEFSFNNFLFRFLRSRTRKMTVTPVALLYFQKDGSQVLETISVIDVYECLIHVDIQ
jgi:hypothetical protein